MFEVPIYALLLDGYGRLIGYECEAQDGIHLAEGYAGGLLFGTIESTLCECGRPGLRLLPPAARKDPTELLPKHALLAG